MPPGAWVLVFSTTDVKKKPALLPVPISKVWCFIRCIGWRRRRQLLVELLEAVGIDSWAWPGALRLQLLLWWTVAGQNCETTATGGSGALLWDELVLIPEPLDGVGVWQGELGRSPWSVVNGCRLLWLLSKHWSRRLSKLSAKKSKSRLLHQIS